MKYTRIVFSGVILLLVAAVSVSAPRAGNEKPSTRAAAAEMNDSENRRRATADLDRDGDVDVIEARKHDWTTEGMVPYAVLVNTDGIVTDRTEALTTNSELAAGPGFGTPNQTGEVTVADLDNDGWLDVVISVEAGKLPWIYLNRCCSVGGCAATSCSTGKWLGLGLVEDRNPEMMSVRIK